MNILKSYRNELLLAMSFLLFLIAFTYKGNVVSDAGEINKKQETSLQELKDVIALKKIWGDKKTGKKVAKLQHIVSATKVRWHKNAKKLKVNFVNLKPSELNRIMVKIMNLAVVIQKLDIRKNGKTYYLELKCKW